MKNKYIVYYIYIYLLALLIFGTYKNYLQCVNIKMYDALGGICPPKLIQGSA